MRLDKCLTLHSIGSRSYVKECIKKGKVTVNGEVQRAPELHVTEEDVICFEGEEVQFSSFEYYLLNKPAGYLTANKDPKKPVVMSLVASKRTDLSPVGRLDKDTEGVLIITNDGALAHRLLAPKNKVEKEYYVETDVPIPENARELLAQPIQFKEFLSEPAVFIKETENSGRIIVHEGKYHEVKRLFHHIGCEVTYLKRVRFHNLTLGELKTGEIRALTETEIETLREI